MRRAARPGAGLRAGLVSALCRVALALVPASFAAGAAPAETARVRSGDHGSFTRLVIELAAPADWRFGRSGGGYALDLGRPGLQLDLRGIYDTISRDRIAAVDQDARSGRVEIALGCTPCHATALDYLGTWIVIDVAAGSPPAGSPFELPLGPAPEAAPGGPDSRTPGAATPDAAIAASVPPAAPGPIPALPQAEPVAGASPEIAAPAAPLTSPPPRPAPRGGSGDGSPEAGATAPPATAPGVLSTARPAAIPAAGGSPSETQRPSLGSAWAGAGRAATLRPPVEAVPGPDPDAAPPPPEETTAGPDRRTALAPAPRADTRPWLAPGTAVPPGLAALDPLDPAATPQPGGEARPGPADYRASLLEELSRAASQGLLEADLPASDRARHRVPAAEPAAPPAATALPAPAADAAPRPEDHVRIEAETSIDRDTGAPRTGGGATPAGRLCVDDAALDVAAWGAGADPSEGISTMRRALVGEFDRPDPAAVLGLARHYLYLGFGAEARATLSAFAVETAGSEVVATMASLLDGDATDLPGSFAGQAACPGRAALWGTLADAGGSAEPPNGRAVVGAFAELPLHVRRHIGPGLAMRLLEAGAHDAALAVREAATRGSAGPSDGFALFDAALAQTEGSADPAAGLARLAGTGEAQGAGAFAAYLEGELDAGRVPETGSVTAAALAFEAGPSDEGRRLAELAIRARLAEGDFDGARQEILRRAAEAPAADAAGHAGHWLRFAEAITAGAPDAEFLRQAFAARQEMAAQLPADAAATALALRLTGLGFAEEALRYLPPASAGEPRGEAARLARAEALLQSGRAAAALDEIAGLPGPAAERLRGRALLARGDDHGAAARFAAAGDARMAERAARQAGAWNMLTEADDPALRQLAERRLARAEPAAAGDDGTTSGGAPPVSAAPEAPAPPGRVEAARAALEAGRAARDLALALLAGAQAAGAP